jgi:hypothetical protein
MHPGLKALLSITGFAARHFLVVALGAGFLCILWTLIYIGLLIFAMFTDGGLGGPFAYPGGILGILLVCVVIGWGIFMPASGLGVIFCRLFKLPKLAAIPVVLISAFSIISLAWYFSDGFGEGVESASSLEMLRNFCLFLAVPLGAYWWITEGPSAIIDAVRRIIAKRRSKSTLPLITDH